MIVDIGLVPIEFYLYGSDDSEEDGEHQDGNVTQYITGTSDNAAQSLTETTSNVTQSLAVTTINVTQSLAATTSNVALYENKIVEEDQDIMDDDDKNPEAVVFDIAGNATKPLAATTGNETQSLTVTTGNVTQSLAAMTSNVAQSTTAATTSNVAQSTTVATGNAAHSPSTLAQSNTQAEVSSLLPEMIAEDAAARELLLFPMTTCMCIIIMTQSCTCTTRISAHSFFQ
jgi:hypothetical protein